MLPLSWLILNIRRLNTDSTSYLTQLRVPYAAYATVPLLKLRTAHRNSITITAAASLLLPNTTRLAVTETPQQLLPCCVTTTSSMAQQLRLHEVNRHRRCDALSRPTDTDLLPRGLQKQQCLLFTAGN